MARVGGGIKLAYMLIALSLIPSTAKKQNKTNWESLRV
jgi:hypothetical protein